MKFVKKISQQKIHIPRCHLEFIGTRDGDRVEIEEKMLFNGEKVLIIRKHANNEVLFNVK